MNTHYLVSEIVDEADGLGDKIIKRIPLAVFDTYTKAAKYVNQYEHQQVYAKPYQSLTFGGLEIYPIADNPTIDVQKLPNYEVKPIED